MSKIIQISRQIACRLRYGEPRETFRFIEKKRVSFSPASDNLGLIIIMALFDWPGKSFSEGELSSHPAVYHMLDVAAVAEQLIRPFL